MYQSIKNTFIDIFDSEPLLVYSPGRINLIGEHTDYNDGYVLPAAIDKKMVVAIAENDSQLGRVYSVDFDHFEVHLADAAVRAQPVCRYILPSGARRNAVIRPTLGFVVDQATDDALPLFHSGTSSGFRRFAGANGRWLKRCRPAQGVLY